ncbi:MAG: type I glyceraldehyde-3-phosphate dehydrogenase [Candidatus Melainabacteria bacterium HGW-Melainabacteria-1]|nr:MAG: type I glyceraldehyde-3-phosphate dehydrogenase [Candidatus Melainabacteria bacterium HGW-Melainabacteria-1]
MTIRVGINGFGRIGRQVFRALSEIDQVEVVAINDLTNAKTLAHLLKYDSVHGTFAGDVRVEGNDIVVNGKTLKVLSERDPAALPWGELGAELVVESTGLFTHADKAGLHIKAGAKKVIISAPATGEDITIVLGVNHDKYDPAKHHIVSNASCTTNCLAPVAKALNDKFGIVRGLMNTIHSYTNDQSILDLPHKDLRRARAAAMSIIPTSTGAAKAVGLVIPELNGKLNGMSMRVPTPDVSVVDLVAEVSVDVTVDEINNTLREFGAAAPDKVLMVCDEPLVSMDFKTNPYSSIVDSALTMVLEKRMIKVISWYDNEWGYSSRVVDLIQFMGKDL